MQAVFCHFVNSECRGVSVTLYMILRGEVYAIWDSRTDR